MTLTKDDTEEALRHLEAGHELVITRGTEAKWRARRGIYLEVELSHAQAVLDALRGRFHVRTGVTPPRRVLTPQPISQSSEEDESPSPFLVAQGWTVVESLAERIPLSKSTVKDEVHQGHLTSEMRTDHDHSHNRPMRCVKPDEALARRLAKRGIEGRLVTPEGRTLDIFEYRPEVVLAAEAVSVSDLAEALDYSTSAVMKRVRPVREDLLSENGYNGRTEFTVGPSLIAFIEDEWNVRVIQNERDA